MSTNGHSAPASSAAATLASLPIVNIGAWLPPRAPFLHANSRADSSLSAASRADAAHPGRLAASAALHAAFLAYGFCYLDVSGFVDPAEPEALLALAREFFARPQTEKDALGLAHSDGARGYQRLKENVTNGKADNHEGLDFYAPVADPDPTRPLHGENQWPAQPAGFRAAYERWAAKMQILGMCVMRAMAAGLGMSDDEWAGLKAQVDDSFWVMRVIGYPPLPDGYDGFSCGAHKDYGCLTLLHADDTRGALQVFLPDAARGLGDGARVQMRAGEADPAAERGVWVNADPIPGCLVVNIGEMWEVWTNGLYKATLHRVVHRSPSYRVSVPFFYEPAFAARVAPLPAALRLQTAKERAAAEGKYAPVTYGDFLLKKVGGNFDLSGGKDATPAARY